MYTIMFTILRMCVFLFPNYICEVTADHLEEFPKLAEGSDWERTQFAAMAKDHKNYCARDVSCFMGTDLAVQSSCCGSCTCDIFCYDHGSCCLSMYETFEHARDSVQKSRYTCVSSQFLQSEEDTDFITDQMTYTSDKFWMITKCNPDISTSIGNKHTCEPIITDYDSLVPVTDPLTNTHYRSKNCALCNLENSHTPLVNWKLRIQSNTPLSFPHNHLFEEIRKTRGNVFYQPPEYAFTQTCKSADYTIDTCNVTGLWQTFDEDIKTACESFVDPFNNTYKNIFCLRCNGGERFLTEECHIKQVNRMIKRPHFAANLDLSFIRSGPDTAALVCEDSQFEDEIKMTCREVSCHEHGKLRNGACKLVYITFDDTYFSIFVKFTPIDGEWELKKNTFNKFDFTYDILNNIEIYDEEFSGEGRMNSDITTEFNAELRKRSVKLQNVIQLFRLFFKTDKRDIINYVVVHIISVFREAKQKYDFLKNIMSKPFMTLFHHTELRTNFSVEPASYKFTTTDDRTIVIVPFNVGMEADELVAEPDIIDESKGLNKDIVELTKIHWCPYVILDLHEFSVRIENDFLMIYDDAQSNKTLKVLSKWEYEVHNGSFCICFHDYLDLYYAIYPKITDKLVDDSPKVFSNVWMNLICFVLIVVCI